MRIESLQNQHVKRLVALQQKAKLRQAKGVFVIEGEREVQRAIDSGFCIKEIWVTKNEFIPKNVASATQIVQCSSVVFGKIAMRREAAKVVAIAESKDLILSALSLPENALVVVLEGIEKPGNIGAVLRTANALQADAVLVCNSAVDLYNPNVIRNSLGGFFNTPIAQTTTNEALTFLKKQNSKIFTTHLSAAVDYLDVNYTGPTALVFGSESKGVSDAWAEQSTQNIIIKMGGIVDSLNISVATSIVLSEAVRQRNL